MTAAVGPARRRWRPAFWAAVLVALVALVGGSVTAYRAYAATTGPAGTVRGYFAALARGDAGAALGFGDIPAGDRRLLTGAVLREQRRIAAVEDLRVDGSDVTGSTGRVRIEYSLEYADGAVQIRDTVPVVRRGGSWRLAATAQVVSMQLSAGGDRATLLRAAVPSGPELLFPGAVPIRFDSPYLELAPETTSVRLGSPAPDPLAVTVTGAGTDAMTAALAAALPGCLAGAPTADPRCPLPAPRAVPASMRGTVVGAVRDATTVEVIAGAAGTLRISGTVTVQVHYSVLDFDNIAHPAFGTLPLSVDARAYAVNPIRLQWQGVSQ